MVLNLSRHVQADAGVHEEAVINHHGCIFLHLFSAVLSRWEEPARVGAGDVERQVELNAEDGPNVPVSSHLCCFQFSPSSQLGRPVNDPRIPAFLHFLSSGDWKMTTIPPGSMKDKKKTKRKNNLV